VLGFEQATSFSLQLAPALHLSFQRCGSLLEASQQVSDIGVS
jgi:hypothetical protein